MCIITPGNKLEGLGIRVCYEVTEEFLLNLDLKLHLDPGSTSSSTLMLKAGRLRELNYRMSPP